MLAVKKQLLELLRLSTQLNKTNNISHNALEQADCRQ